MSNLRLPPELLDHIVDVLHDNDALYPFKECCLVSKSWIPRTRRHLFANIKFCTEGDMQLWKKTFPDPSTSPAHYAKILLVDCPRAITTADAGPGGWITGFSGVIRLEVVDRSMAFRALADGFAPFHGFSPVIKSLCVDFVHLPPQTFDLIISFPLLEDLTLTAYSEMITYEADGSDGLSTVVQPSSSPAFTGSLELLLERGRKPIAHRLLSLPGGLHFRMLAFIWLHEEDLLLTKAFVEGCSHTLESLNITCELHGTSIQHLPTRL